MSVQFKVFIFILIFISVFINVFNFKFILFLESILDIRYICTCIFITKALCVMIDGFLHNLYPSDHQIYYNVKLFIFGDIEKITTYKTCYLILYSR